MLFKYIKKIEPIIEELNGKRIKEINGVICPDYLYSFPNGLWLSFELDERDHYCDVKLGRLFSFDDVMPRLLVLERIEYYFDALNVKYKFFHTASDVKNIFEILKNNLKIMVENYQLLKENEITKAFILNEERRLKSYLLADLSNSTNLEYDLKDRIESFNNRFNKKKEKK